MNTARAFGPAVVTGFSSNHWSVTSPPPQTINKKKLLTSSPLRLNFHSNYDWYQDILVRHQKKMKKMETLPVHSLSSYWYTPTFFFPGGMMRSRVGPSLGSLLAVTIYALMKWFRYWRLSVGQDTDESSKSPALFVQEAPRNQPTIENVLDHQGKRADPQTVWDLLGYDNVFFLDPLMMVEDVIMGWE